MADDFVTEPPRQTPVLLEADVVVIGGGLSGVGAAVGAARAGAKTVLIERTGFLGGWIRGTGLGGRLAVSGWRPSLREGLLLDITKGVVEAGLEPYTDLERTLESGDINVTSNHEIMPNVFQSLALNAGVKILYFSNYSGSIVTGGKIEAVLIDTPGGRYAVRGKTFIDCTGLASVAAESGSPTKKDLQESELGLAFQITNVDRDRYEAWAKTRPKEGSPELRTWVEARIGRPITLEPGDPRDNGFLWSWGGWWDRNSGLLGDLIREAVEKGDLTLFERIGDRGTIGIFEGLKMGSSEVGGTAALPRTFVKGVDPSDVLQVTEAHIISTRMAMEYGRFLRKYVPGFEKSQVTRLADMTLNRAGRSIDNEIAPTREEASTAVSNDDAVAVLLRGPESGIYEVPYRTMVADKIDNLLAVGKSSSGGRTFRTHMLSVIMGQAAGTAAALAVQEKVAVRDVPIRELQAKLRAAGIGIPEKPKK